MDDLIRRGDAITAARHAWAKSVYPKDYIEAIPAARDEAMAAELEDTRNALARTMDERAEAVARWQETASERDAWKQIAEWFTRQMSASALEALRAGGLDICLPEQTTEEQEHDSTFQNDV